MKAHRRPYRRSVASEEGATAQVVVAPMPVTPLVLHMPLRSGRLAPPLASIDPWRAMDPMKR